MISGKTLLAACLTLPLLAATGQAQPAPQTGGRMIYVPPGVTVVILPGVVATQGAVNANAPEAPPVMRLIAEQQAMMQHMMADMNAMFPPMPDPTTMLRAAFGSGAPLDIAMMPMAGGHGVCSQSISIVDRGDGSAPIVKTSQSGDACGAMGIGQPQGVDQIRPVPPASVPPHGPKVLEVGYPPQKVTDGLRPRT